MEKQKRFNLNADFDILPGMKKGQQDECRSKYQDYYQGFT